MDGTESVRSGYSERSHRSHRSSASAPGGHRAGRHRASAAGRHRGANGALPQHHAVQIGAHKAVGMSVGGENGGPHSHMNNHSGGQQQQHPHHHNSRSKAEEAGMYETRTMQDNEETIEVQIIPQDDDWGDNTTAITGATSERSFSQEDISKLYREHDRWSFRCMQLCGSALAAILCLVAYVSPIAFVLIPRFKVIPGWELTPCAAECEGLLISFTFKLVILAVGSWAVFLRRPKATLPRVHTFRAIILALVFLFTFCYWLFYGVRILEEAQANYYAIVQFATSNVDALLFIHYAGLVLLEVRHLSPQYVVKVVRSPDGAARSYTVGQLSVQRAAVWCLEQYYRDFNVYNPYLDKLPGSRRKNSAAATQFKLYDLGPEGGGKGGSGDPLGDTARAMWLTRAVGSVATTTGSTRSRSGRGV